MFTTEFNFTAIQMLSTLRDKFIRNTVQPLYNNDFQFESFKVSSIDFELIVILTYMRSIIKLCNW